MEFTREILIAEYKNVGTNIEGLQVGTPTQQAQMQNFREKLFDLRYDY